MTLNSGSWGAGCWDYGDGKVRSTHAERDGKVFSWDDPPEGGHPGEAPNCRCTAEEVEEPDPEKEKRCQELTWKIKNKEELLGKLKEELSKAEEEVCDKKGG